MLHYAISRAATVSHILQRPKMLRDQLQKPLQKVESSTFRNECNEFSYPCAVKHLSCNLHASQRFSAPANATFKADEVAKPAEKCYSKFMRSWKRDRLHDTLLSVTPVKQLVSYCENVCRNGVARQAARKIAQCITAP